MFRFFNSFMRKEQARKNLFGLTLCNLWSCTEKEKKTLGWHMVCLIECWVCFGFVSEQWEFSFTT